MKKRFFKEREPFNMTDQTVVKEGFLQPFIDTSW
jgi:hypothetical protein